MIPLPLRTAPSPISNPLTGVPSDLILETKAPESELTRRRAPFPSIVATEASPSPEADISAPSRTNTPSLATSIKSAAESAFPALSMVTVGLDTMIVTPFGVTVRSPPMRRLPAFQEVSTAGSRTILPAAGSFPTWNPLLLLRSMSAPRPPEEPDAINEPSRFIEVPALTTKEAASRTGEEACVERRKEEALDIWYSARWARISGEMISNSRVSAGAVRESLRVPCR